MSDIERLPHLPECPERLRCNVCIEGTLTQSLKRERAAHEATYREALGKLTASESAHAETRREWYAAVGRAQESYTELENDMKAHLRAAQGEIDASIAREAEMWRMVEALIEGIANAPGRLPSYIQEPRDALLAARAERVSNRHE